MPNNKLTSTTATATLALVAFCGIQASGQTIFTYGNKPVSQQEFVQAFEKNPSAGDRRKALADYLPLFMNYKLKVQDALDKKLDTLPNQKSELDNYRSQLVENYINTHANTSALVQEAFRRSQREILLGHLYVGFTARDSTSILQANEKAVLAKKALDAKQDFAAVVKTYSTDEANRNSGGRAGWITAFSIPYPFETMVYELPMDGYSGIIRSSNGFHIFKKMGERPASGTVKLAQIMLVNPEPGNKTREEKNEKLADSLYNALLKGAKFETLAEQFSNDRTSYSIGGLLPEFGVGTYSGVFEDVAFSLKNKGDISKPFATEYGIHILKLVDRTPTPSDNTDGELLNKLLEKVTATGRAQSARQVFLKNQMQQLKWQPAVVNEPELFRFTDSSLAGAKDMKGIMVNAKTPLGNLASQAITAGDWLSYVKIAKFLQANENRSYADLLQNFYLGKTEEYLLKNIEKMDAPVNRQLKEFKDANLLFEAMERNVWNKAAADTMGLQNWYKQHRDHYKWSKSATALMFSCSDSTILPEVMQALRDHPQDWNTLPTTYANSFFADSGRYELAQLPIPENEIKPGLLTQPTKNELDGTYSFALIGKLLPEGEQRSFEEAKGFVINDYQLWLEEKWLEQLKKKYPVKLNTPVWNKLLSAQ